MRAREADNGANTQQELIDLLLAETVNMHVDITVCTPVFLFQ